MNKIFLPFKLETVGIVLGGFKKYRLTCIFALKMKKKTCNPIKKLARLKKNCDAKIKIS